MKDDFKKAGLVRFPDRCGRCKYFKSHRQDVGMCQSPSQAKKRGADKGKGWVQSEPGTRCWTGEFEIIAAPLRAKE